MPDRQEILNSIYGAYLLARMDGAGAGHFNLSVDGFWRSFFAAVLVAPGYALLVAERLSGQPEEVDGGRVFLVHTIAYALSWIVFPLAALVLTYLLNVTRNYVALIVMVNWAAVIQIVVFLAAIAVSAILPPVLAGLLLTLVTVAILFYQWFVTRTALQTTGGIAFALVLLDLVLNTTINIAAAWLI